MPFVKGQSGNPAGRKKSEFGLAKECQRHTSEIVANMVAIMRGESIRRTSKQKGARGKKEHVFDTPQFSDRIRAMEWLTERGWGKAMQAVEVGHDGVIEIICRGMPMPTQRAVPAVTPGK